MQKFNYTRHQSDDYLIDFLTRRFPYLPREDWQEAIISGAIRVNGRQVNLYYMLINKDIISYDRPRSAEPEIDTTFELLYQDDTIIVVNKNGNIPIDESGKYYRNTLINILKEKAGFEELYAVHRLDKETSGVILISRKKEIASILGEQFSQQIPQKEYVAILRGELKEEEILVDQPIKKNIPLPGRVRIRQIISPTGKPSKTLFTRYNVANGLTLAHVKLFTGRTHQIRCHAEFIRYPILGDKLYGQSDRQFLAILKEEMKPDFPPYGIIDRQLLHAYSLEFEHPVSGETMKFTSDYRKEFSKYESVQSLIN